MPIATPPFPATVYNAAANNRWVAEQIRDNPNSDVNGRTRTGARCTCCSRKPPSGELCEVVIDSATNLVVQVGVGVCHYHLLRAELVRLLASERAGTHPQKAQRISRIQNAISKLPRTL